MDEEFATEKSLLRFTLQRLRAWHDRHPDNARLERAGDLVDDALKLLEGREKPEAEEK